VRCGTKDAMPVGWTLPADQRPTDSIASEPALATVLKVLCAMGVFFGLMALLPDFDGWGEGDWEGEADKRRRRR